MIYVVEDDKGIRDIVVYSLNSTGLEAEGFDSAPPFWERLSAQLPELVLLDIMLPGEDGIEILTKLKKDAQAKKTPVIMVTAKGAEYDKVIGLDTGADDYVTKPFGMMELLSRIRAVLRRAAPEPEGVLSFRGVTINPLAHTVTVNGKPTEITLKEFDLLYLLIKNTGTVMTREVLLQSVWGYGFDGETRTVDVHIMTLRTKLGDGGDIIETVRGVGYKVGGTL